MLEVLAVVRRKESGVIMSLLFSAKHSAQRSTVDVLLDRTVAITVVLGRKRRARVRPNPMPVVRVM